MKLVEGGRGMRVHQGRPNALTGDGTPSQNGLSEVGKMVV